jgi:hypothetical protein
MLTFFGLTPEYRKTLHKNIFDLIYYGNGGFNWSDVYDMPVWLRLFYIKNINEVHKKDKKSHEKAMREARSKSRAKPPRVRR